MYSHSAQYIISHWALLWRVTKAELTSRYAGSLLGFGWVFLSPLLILSIYGIVYLEIFKVRVSTMSPFEYVLFIFSGLVPFLATAEALNFGVVSVIVDKSVLNSTVFPIDLAPVKGVFLSQGNMITGFVVIILGALVLGKTSWVLATLPLIWLLHIMGLVGLNWFLSLLNVVFRDLQNVMPAVTMMLLIASPIAYTAEMVPESLKFFLYINPFAYFVIAYQHVLVLGKSPEPFIWVALVGMSFTIFALGSIFFHRAKGVIIDYV